MRVLLALAFLMFALALAGAQVGQPAGQKAAAARVARDFAVPRYRAFLASANDQEEAWKRFCAAPTEGDVDILTRVFADSVIAWSRIELVRYGPVSQDFRYERIAYWPERKNDVSRALARLLAEEAPVDAVSMLGRSVAVQGLSALERLLYDDGARAALLAGDADARRHCAAGAAIAANVRQIAADISAEWTELAPTLEAADEATAREAVSRLATDFLTVYQVVGDQKLDVPMGLSLEEARPKSAQYWRSGLSNGAMAANLESAADFAALILGSSNTGTQTIRAAQRLAEELPGPVSGLVTQNAGRSRLLLLRNAVRKARDLTAESVPAALGITIGFNSLDGD